MHQETVCFQHQLHCPLGAGYKLQLSKDTNLAMGTLQPQIHSLGEPCVCIINSTDNNYIFLRQMCRRDDNMLRVVTNTIIKQFI